MKTKCPACGATTSLDALLGHSEASRAFLASLNLTGELAAPLIKYLGLFRSENRDLSFERTARLLNEITPDIVAKKIQRNRQMFSAPIGAWVWAIGQILERRQLGKIDLPLKTHGYLYEVISSYKPENAPVTPTIGVIAKSDAELAADQAQHEQLKRERPAITFAEAVANAKSEKPLTTENNRPEARALKGIPQAQLFAHVAQNRRTDESHDECYQRLKALETQEQGVTP